jgi:multidrug transporter EmrE-like cation transporter
MSEEEKAEAAASAAMERSVARTIGRPLGGLLGVVGFGLAIACLGFGVEAHAAAVGWATLGAFGFAMMAVGNAAVDSAG